MNSIKLPPIVQESIFSTNLISNDTEDISILPGMILLDSAMPAFTQTEKTETHTIEKECGTSSRPSRILKRMYVIKGEVNMNENCCLYCPECNCTLSHNCSLSTSMKHIPFVGEYTESSVSRNRYVCSNEECSYFWDEGIPFKATEHFLTVPAENYVMDLLRLGHTLKDVSIITGIGKNVVKAIDKKRLEKLYTVDGEGKELLRPTETVRHLGIDEFLLHKGHKYATIIMDLDTGHVLYLAHGKKKQVVYDFIDWIGMDLMKSVEALGCDMSSDYEKLLKEKLEKVYNAQTERSMKIHINRIIRLCNETDNTHFKWFARLLENHKEGIINHAIFHISSGKVEGTNNMIKTLRRKGYGYDDDDYFFLKIIDASHRFS